MQIQETGAAMSDIMLELNEAGPKEGGMTGCLSCSVDVFTVDSAKRFAAGLQVGYMTKSFHLRPLLPVPLDPCQY